MARKRNTGLVPPPPPVPVSPGMFATQGTVSTEPLVPQAPMIGFQRQPLQRVNVDPSAFKNLFAPNPALKQQGELVQQANNRLRFLSDGLSNANSLGTNFELPQPSPMQEALTERIYNSLLENLNARNSVGNRFQRGFDFGQQLAASTIIPAMGAFGGGTTAMGANAAVREINQNLRARGAQRIADKNSNNQAISQLSQIFDKISPTSAQNVTRNIQAQMAIRKANLEAAKLAFDAEAKATEQLNTSYANAVKNDATARRDAVTALLGLGGLQNSANRNITSDNRLNLDAAKEGFNRLDTDRRFQELVRNNQANNQIGKANVVLGFQNFGQRQQEAQDKNTRAANELQQRSGTDLLKMVINANKIGTAVDQVGNLRNPGFQDQFGSDPLSQAAVSNLANNAGVSVPAQQPVSQETANLSKEEQSTVNDFLGSILPNLSQGLGSVVRTFNGNAQQGQKEQPQKRISLSTQGNSALGSLRKNPSDLQALKVLTPEIANFLRARGEKPTAETIDKMLEAMLGRQKVAKK